MTPEEILEEMDACETKEAILDIVRALATQYFEEGYKAGYAQSQSETPVA